MHTNKNEESLTTYSFSEVIHRLWRGVSASPDKEPVNNFAQQSRVATLSPVAVRIFNHIHTMDSIRLFDDDRTQSRSHAYSDAGTGCLALYELQPVATMTKQQPKLTLDDEHDS
jgi:hypothetical protein